MGRFAGQKLAGFWNTGLRSPGSGIAWAACRKSKPFWEFGKTGVDVGCDCCSGGVTERYRLAGMEQVSRQWVGQRKRW